MAEDFFKHATALVESDRIGTGTRIWAYAHVLHGATIGQRCSISDYVFVEGDCVIGDNVTVKNHVCLWEGITVQDDVFIGPHVIFTNDRFPRSPRMARVQGRYANKRWLQRTLIGRGSTIGAGATVLPGLKLGEYCFVAAGSLVTRDVPAYALVCGAPARHRGYVCACGQRAKGDTPGALCFDCKQQQVDNSKRDSHDTFRFDSAT